MRVERVPQAEPVRPFGSQRQPEEIFRQCAGEVQLL